MLFALEVILASWAPRHMSGVVIASVTAAITSRQIVGEELALRAAVYDLGQFSELALYGGLAIVVVGFGWVFLSMLDALEGASHRHRARLGPLRPLLAGLGVAALVLIEPQVGGTGQDVTNRLLISEQVTAITGAGGDLWWVLGLIALGKAAATSLTIASGGSGGAFMPSLFMGAAVGTGFARLAEPLWPGEIEAGAFAVVGMAAMFAVVARAPLTSILIVFEVTGARDYGLILPLMLAATLGTFLAERFTKDSAYTMALRRKGIPVRGATGSVDLLDTIEVGSVMTPPPFEAAPSMPVAEVERQLTQARAHGAPVVDDGRLIGIVTVTDINRAHEDPDNTTAGQVMTPRPVTVVPSTPVSRALERMAGLGVGRLPVVDESDPGMLVGMFRREEAVRAYHQALEAGTDLEMERLRLAQRTDPGAGYYDFRVPRGSVADRRAVRDVPWPEGSTLVAVRRGRDVLVPRGDTVLAAGDVVTAFGSAGSRQRTIDRLNSGADEPTAEIFLEDPE